MLDNLPKVAHEKYDKLAGVVRKVISQVGVSIRGGVASLPICLPDSLVARQLQSAAVAGRLHTAWQHWQDVVGVQELRAFTCLKVMMMSRE